ncbi:MAG: ASKHA domain-containing protein [Elusimicrobia bacterium]|nr:ASKHA domain-containing protein [Elusimicrobiota bacterium]
MVCKIKFLPYNKVVSVQEGTDLLTAAMMAGIQIYNSCGGEGVCGKCKVKVTKGEVVTDSPALTKKEKKDGYVLACRTNCKGHMEVFIPEEARVGKAEILTKGTVTNIFTPAEPADIKTEVFKENIFKHSPFLAKLYLELPKPSIDDSTADLERILREIRKKGIDNLVMQMGLSNIKKLPLLLRSTGFKVTVTLGNRNGTTEIVLVEPSDTSNKNYGIAVDIGTTTIVTYLVNLNNQDVLSAKAIYNPQVSFGEDVITRIIHAEDPAGLDRLHHSVVDVINDLIISHVIENKISLNDINCVVCAGNTTMIHLLLRVDPSNIRRSPYIPVANSFPVIRASEAGIKINPRGLLATLPNISSYIGGDITAGVLASGINSSSGLTLFIDLGTNGEVVLGNKDFLVCCSTSAGPCFEGGGIKNGIRAQSGAIESFELNNDKIKIKIINNEKAIGICGAGIISIIAELFKKGIIDKSGEFIQKSSKYLKKTDEEVEFFVTSEISITQADIKNLIHSKGAIFSGAEVLIKKMGFDFNNLDRVIIAGGLGNALDIEKSIMIGLLPDLPKEKFIFIGNGSITGAKMCLLSQDAMKKAEELAQKMTYIDLSENSEFMNNYTASLFLPHTDMDLFPNVKSRIGNHE